MKLGFFDSGIGGITVLHEAVKQMPNEEYLYYADTDNTPYGTKPKHLVREYVMNAVDFIMDQGVDAVVVACNTATSIAIEDLRHKYCIPILGMEPAVKPAMERSQMTSRRVIVTATPLTLKEEKLKNLIAKVGNEELVDLLPLPRLVEFAESYRFDDAEVEQYIGSEFGKFNLDEYGTVVLGCTHFPFFKGIMRKLFPCHVDIIDGGEGTVRNLKRIVLDKGFEHSRKSGIEFYHSGRHVSQVEEQRKFDILFHILDKNEQEEE